MLRTSLVLCCLLLAHAGLPAQLPGAVTCEALSMRFGILPAFPVSGLVAGGVGRIK